MNPLLWPLPIAMAWLSAMCGGSKPKLPLGLDQLLYAVPFASVAYAAVGPVGLVAYPTAVLGKRTGHGRGMDLKTPHLEVGSKPEKVEILIRWLEGRSPVYAYKLLILWLTQLLLVSGLVAAYAISGLWAHAGCALALSLTKPIAYALAHLLPDFSWAGRFRVGHARGELLTGLFDGLGLLGLWAIS